MKTIKNLIFILIIALFVNSVFALSVFATTNATGYAYGENVGWANFNPTNGGATVTATGLSGYIWLENVGWVQLSYPGVTSPSNTTSTNWGVTNDGNGNLGGYAYGENVGWINFNPTNGGVKIDGSGNFSGYAWGENIGWIQITYTGVTSPANTTSTNWGVTTAWISNSPPTFTAGPSDGGSASSAPTNAGQKVLFTATATTTLSDNYYLAVCRTNSITPHNNAAPTCDSGQALVVSSSTASGSPALCSGTACAYTTSAGDIESNAWYAFVCDRNSPSLCSAASQGNLSDPTGSPFFVNHAPSFTAATVSTNPIASGFLQTFSSVASDSDTLAAPSADTVQFFACRSNDFNGTSCGSGGTWCNSSASASNPSCSYTIQTSDGYGTKNYFGYVIDNHNFSSTSNPISGTFIISGSAGGTAYMQIKGFKMQGITLK